MLCPNKITTSKQLLGSCLDKLQAYILKDLNIINIPLFDTF